MFEDVDWKYVITKLKKEKDPRLGGFTKWLKDFIDHKTSDVADFEKEAIELSNLDVKRATISRENKPSFVLETQSPYVFQVYSHIFFSVHSVTHIDLPGSLGVEEERAAIAHDPSIKMMM